MKTQIKFLALSVLILAGCFAASAQKSFLINDIYPLLAQNSDVQSEIVLSAEFFSDSHQFYTEEKLELESWMTENWELTARTGLDRSEREEELSPEAWMITPFSPESVPGWDFITADPETPQKLEEWMICCYSWGRYN